MVVQMNKVTGEHAKQKAMPSDNALINDVIKAYNKDVDLLNKCIMLLHARDQLIYLERLNIAKGGDDWNGKIHAVNDCTDSTER